jgi:hypothetical protein
MKNEKLILIHWIKMSDLHLIFHGDIFKYVLFNYLSPKDILKLQKVFHYTEDIFDKKVIQNIENRLKLIFSDEEKYQKFKELMTLNKGYIAGSFLTQCILEEYWDDSNIDIFFIDKGDKGAITLVFCMCERERKPKFLSSKKTKDLLEKFLIGEGAFDTNGYKTNHFFNFMRLNWSMEFPLKDDIINSEMFVVNGFKIRTINIDENEFLKPDKLVDFECFMDKLFDFEVCKNFINWDKDGKMFYKIKNLQNIFDKKFTYVRQINNPSVFGRTKKYQNRGFTVTEMLKI